MGQEKLKGIEKEAQELQNTSDSPGKEKESQVENKEELKNESQKEIPTIEEMVGESDRIIDKVEGMVEEEKRKRSEETKEGENKTREGVSVRVRPLLEAALQHSLAVAYCATQSDHTAIMTAAENVCNFCISIIKFLQSQGYAMAPCIMVDFEGDPRFCGFERMNVTVISLSFFPPL